MEMKFKSILFKLSLIIFIGVGLTSCNQQPSEKVEDDKIYINSFQYEINRNKAIVANELSYSLTFDIDFTLNQKFNVNDLVVRIATIEGAVDNKKSFHFAIDYSNTEDVYLSSSEEKYPYILLKYAIVNDTALSVDAQIKIATIDLINDINDFIKIDCYSESKEIIDENNHLNNGTFKMNYSDDSLIYYEFDEYSESYKVVSAIVRSDSFAIPSTYKGYPVKTIGEGAFFGCSSLKSITIPDSVTTIEGAAFWGCINIEKATIPAFAILAIPKDSLKEVEITSGRGIAESAFSGCSKLTKIIIPNSVTSIGESAFWGCSSLTSIVIPDCVTSIGESAFSNCSNLQNIVLPDSLTSIAEGVFWRCSSLLYNEYDNCYYLGNETNPYLLLVKAKSEDITSCDINNNTKLIFSSAFSNCSKLTSITIPDSLTSIADNVFSGCVNIEKATMPTLAIPAIPKDSLKEVVITSGTSIEESTFSECENLTSVTIENGVVDIGDRAFWCCRNLTSITLPNSLTSISNNAFSGCVNIEKVTIPALAIPAILKGNLKEVVITSGQIIEESAFSGCSSLTSVTIGNGVADIEEKAFWCCTNLTSIVLLNSVTNIGKSAFSGCSSLASITIPDSVTNIEEDAFWGCTNLISIILPNSVTNIGECAFSSCSSLSNIVIPDSVKSIADTAFFGCTNIERVTIPTLAIPAIPKGSLKEVVITSGTSIEESAFSDCSSLTSVTIENGIVDIGNRAFWRCSSLINIIIPNSVTSIGESAFSGFCKPKEVYYYGTTTEWESIKMGSNNENLTSATIYYYSEMMPSNSGKYWHYVNGVVTKW